MNMTQRLINGISKRYEESSFDREVRTKASSGSVNIKEKRAQQAANNNHRFVTALSVLLSVCVPSAAKLSFAGILQDFFVQFMLRIYCKTLRKTDDKAGSMKECAISRGREVTAKDLVAKLPIQAKVRSTFQRLRLGGSALASRIAGLLRTDSLVAHQGRPLNATICIIHGPLEVRGAVTL